MYFSKGGKYMAKYTNQWLVTATAQNRELELEPVVYKKRQYFSYKEAKICAKEFAEEMRPYEKEAIVNIEIKKLTS